MYTIKYEPYLDNLNDKSYRNIVTINQVPSGPLKDSVVRIRRAKLSPFSQNRGSSQYSCETPCVYAFTQRIYSIVLEEEGVPCGCGGGSSSYSGGDDLLCVDQIPDLLEIALTNNYTIDYKLSKLLTTTGVGSSNTHGSHFVCSLFYHTSSPSSPHVSGSGSGIRKGIN